MSYLPRSTPTKDDRRGYAARDSMIEISRLVAEYWSTGGDPKGSYGIAGATLYEIANEIRKYESALLSIKDQG